MREPTRRIRDKLERDESSFGTTVQLASVASVEVAGYVGYDFVWIDAEHGTLTLDDLDDLIRAAEAVGVDALVRVPNHDPSFIQRVLDIGATGIIAPHVRTVEQARDLVAAAHFPPAGVRGACPATRAVGHISADWRMDSARMDADVLVFGLIEDLDAVDNVEAIAAESGLDGILAGPFDLSMALGLHGEVGDARVLAMQERIATAAKDAGVQYVAIPSWESRDLPTLHADGVRVYNISGDRGALFAQYAHTLMEATAALGTPVALQVSESLR